MSITVASFTDTYHATVNGVSYTVDTWASAWNELFGTMHVVYPEHPEYTGSEHEFAAPSVAFPLYDTYRSAAPWVPRRVHDCDVVHIHSLFTLGASGIALAKIKQCPVVATYHTPINEYTEHIVPSGVASKGLKRILRRQEQFLLNSVDQIIVPSENTQSYLKQELNVSTPVRVVSNGVDIDHFAPKERAVFRNKYDLSGVIVGYTGRHSSEKCLERVIQAAAKMEREVTVVFSGDGPAREHLERIAEGSPVDTEFLGFVDREELPYFYSALDVFAFPSPIETEGIVAMESIACGTPVVAVDAGALSQTVTDGENGYLFEKSSVSDFATKLEDAISNRSQLSENCLDYRSEFAVSASLIELKEVYRQLLTDRG